MLEDIINQFEINGSISNIVAYGEGHINSTYKVDTDSGESYILQKINTSIFKNYVGMINNIRMVLDYLKQIILKNGGDATRESMTMIPCVDGKDYYMSGDECYRLYTFVANSVTYQQVENPEILENAGYAFGKFMADLDGFDANKLIEVIPHFHDTPDRFHNFLRAVKENKANRLADVKEEVEFFKERYEFYSVITDALNTGNIPMRVTHNDTKLNNVLFDKDTGEVLCVVDLDTIMPGSAVYDFGDAVRFGCSTAREDEPNLDKVHFDINLYSHYLRGYLRGVGDNITDEEINLLHIGAIMMTLECGMRFLADYLEGDIYFKTAYPEHNLVRSRTQIKLATEMEQSAGKMQALADMYRNNK